LKILLTCLCGFSLLLAGCGKTKTEKTAAGKTGGHSGGAKKRPDWPLDEFKDKNPVLVIAVDQPSSPKYQKFMAGWPAAEATAKHQNLAIVEVFGTYDSTRTGRIRGGRALTRPEAINVRDAFGGNFVTLHVTLLGKDGKIIKKFQDPQDPQEVLAELK